MNDSMKQLSWSQTEEIAFVVSNFLAAVQNGENTDKDGWVNFKFLKFREDLEAPGDVLADVVGFYRQRVMSEGRFPQD